MKNIKEQILAYFRHDRKFDNGARLYQKIGNNNAFKNQLNHALATGNPSRVLAGQLNEYLAEMAGISTHVMMNYLNQPLTPRPIDQVEEVLDITSAEADKTDTDAGAGTGDKTGKAETGEQGSKVVSIADLPKPVLHGMKLRDEFPFLTGRYCPPSLKKLVGTMLEAYDKYRFAHEDLFAAESFKAEQEATLAVLDNYLENQQAWDELNHFKEKGELLGNHPVVRAEMDELEIEKLSPIDLAKERSNLQKSTSRYRTMITNENKKGEAADAEKIQAWQLLYDSKQSRLDKVEARILAIQQQTTGK